MAMPFEKTEAGTITTLATTRGFTDCELGIRPGVQTFKSDLKKLREEIQKESPSKRYFLAQRLGHNTQCKVIEAGDLTRNWTENENSCSPIMFRTQGVYDSIIFPKEGVWVEDSYGRVLLTAENMVALIMAADCPGIMIDAGDYIAVVHASLKVLHDDTDSSSGLLNTLRILINELGVPVETLSVSASHSIGPDLYKFSLTQERWGEMNRARQDRLQSLFGPGAAVERDGNSHVDLMEIINQQLLSMGLTEEQIYLDRRCTAGAVDEYGEFKFPSHARGDVPNERFAVCRWVR